MTSKPGCRKLTGTTMHWVAWRWTHSHPAGFVAASVFLTTPWVSQTFVPIVPHLAAFQLFPLIVYLAHSELEPRQAFWLIVAVVGHCLTDLVYVAPAVLVPLALLSGLRLVRVSSRRSGIRLAVVLAISVLALAPVLYAYAVVARHPQSAGAWSRVTPTRRVQPRVTSRRQRLASWGRRPASR